MFPEPTELLLIGCSIDSIWTQDPNQIHRHHKPTRRHTDKGKFHTWWVESSFVFVPHQPIQFHQLSWVMSKRKQEDAVGERVTAKSKPMMNLVSQCSIRDLNVLASTASHSPVKTRHECQIPLSSWNEQHLRTVRLVKDAWSSSCSEWNADEKWSSQEWKSDEMLEARTERPASGQSAGSFTQHTDRFVIDDHEMDNNTVEEIRHVVKNPDHSCTGWMIECERCWTNPQKMQHKTAKNILWYGECLSSTLQASVFLGKEHSENLHSIKNTGKDFTMKQMCDTSEKLIVGQSDEIFGVTPINWRDSSWKQLSLVGDENVISLLHAKVYVLSDSVLCLGNMNQNPTSNSAWENRLTWLKSSPQHRTLDTIDGEPMEFEWNIFPGFTTFQLCNKVQELLSKLSVTPENFRGRIIFMSMLNDISWWSEDNERECNANADLVSIFAKRFAPGRWSFLGPGPEKKWYSSNVDSPQEERDRVAELMMIKFGESGHPVFRATSPLSRETLKSKGGGKLSIHFFADGDTIETFSHNNFC